MKSVTLSGISKHYANKTVFENLNLEIPSGKFFVLLGPSGCGKTTILRIIAGLEEIDDGLILLGEKNITSQPAYKRKINTVFQSQALFPHMSVRENVAYGLSIRNVEPAVIKNKVDKLIKSMGLLGLENKFPSSLSGGQKQRVALARALIVEPDVLLFDEPLSALDMRLKDRMIAECVQLHKELQTTFVYITHDQKEALVAADIIAVMNLDGKIEQIGSPQEIYDKPKTKFIANFVGNSTIFSGTLLSIEKNLCYVEVENIGQIKAKIDNIDNWMIPGRQVFLGIKPEKINIGPQKNSACQNSIQGKLVSSMYAGKYTQHTVQMPNQQEVTVFQGASQTTVKCPKIGESVSLEFQAEHIVMLED